MELVRMKPHHSEELYGLVDISRQDLTNLIWSASATLESTHKFLQEKSGHESKDAVFGIFLYDGEDDYYHLDPPSTRLAGCVELRDMGDHVQLGYWLGTPYRGQGIMQEAVKKLLENQRFMDRPITVRIRSGNVKSLAIVKGAGFVETSNDEEWTSLAWHS